MQYYHHVKVPTQPMRRRFLELPAELRIMIYELVIGEWLSTVKNFDGISQVDRWTAIQSLYRKPMPMLAKCRSIRAEFAASLSDLLGKEHGSLQAAGRQTKLELQHARTTSEEMALRSTQCLLRRMETNALLAASDFRRLGRTGRLRRRSLVSGRLRK